MYDYLYGRIAALTPTTVTLDAGTGIGWQICITLNTYTAIHERTECKLFIHENIREDAWTLYGFDSEREREMFRALIGVSGVGATTAMLILSGLGVAQLENAIAGGNAKVLKNVKGVGAKTAERIIVDLRDKIKVSDATLSIEMLADNDVYDEALAALVMLGYTKQASQKALKKLFDAEPSITVEKAIKKALSMM